MTRLTTNRSPYFDDFDAAKGFYSVLFRPKRTIQTRELNQLQSILSNQIETFADHFFKFGSMVKSGSVRLKNHIPYVRLKDLTPDGQAINTARIGKTVRGKNSGLIAEVIHKTAKDDFDPATLFLNYKNSAVDGETKAFIDGEEIQVLDDAGYVVYRATVRCPTCETNPDSDTIDPTGSGCLFAVEPSVYYVNGRFVPSSFQMVVLDKYGTQPSRKVGFDIVQSFVTSQEDGSLNDNSLGEPNQSAPGADRYSMRLILNHKPLNDNDDENFVMLAKVEGGNLQEVKDKPQYAELMNTMARRTYDESGDYTVRPFTINFKEHLASAPGANDGFLSAENGGDESKFATIISPGKAYVRGREVELIADKIVAVEKARDTAKKRSTVIRPQLGNYLTVELDAGSNAIPLTNVGGAATANDFKTVALYDAPVSGGVPSGNQIGTARVKGIELLSGFVGGTDENAPVWALFVFDIVLNQGKTLLDIQAVVKSGAGSQTFMANISPDEDGNTKLYEPSNNTLLFGLPFPYTKSIRDADNPLISNTTITVTKKMTGSVNSSGNVVFAAEGNETFLTFNSASWIGGLQNSPSGNYEPIDLTQAGTVTTTPSQIIVSVGPQHNGKDFVLLAEVLLSGATEKTKSVNTKIISNASGAATTINLGVRDAFRIKSVIDLTNGNADVTHKYELVTNAKDNYYDLSFIKLKSGVQASPGTTLKVTVDYFEHSNDGDFFSVDSYTAIINDPDIDFTYEDIPTHTSKSGVKYRLSDAIDFRPSVGADGTFSGTGAILSEVPVDSSNVIFDTEYYLPRVDTLCVTDLGEFRMVKGVPAEAPVPPSPAENSMPIYNLMINAYTFDVKRDIKTSYIDNKRYTMKDIGRLDKRISNLEYYVTFNLLEKETSEMNILDADGNNRFKNGFLVDNFKDYQACQTGSPEFNCALDTKKGELRPSFLSRSIQLALNESASANFVQKSDMTLLPYTEVVYQDQPYSSKTISVNPYFIYEVEGKVQLSPEMDVWKDIDTAPDVVVNIDTGVDALRDVANAAGILGTQWNNWQTTASQLQTSSVWSGREWNANSFLRGWNQRTPTQFLTTTTQRTTTQQRSGTTTSIQEQIQNSSLGEAVTSVNIIPYIRSIEVQFVATNMKPRTKVYAFFDGVDVTDDCRMLNKTFSAPLVTDDKGTLVGTFRIPNRPDKRFFTGTRVFRLTNTPDNNKDPDELTTSAEAQFFAGGIQETRRETVLSVRSPQVIETETTQQRTTTTRETLVRRFGDDPLAQSFTVPEEDGVMLTGVEVYFSAKSKDTPVWLQIRNMSNGYPASVIVPYSETTVQPDAVKVSEDASQPTMFKFEAPVFLQSDEEYCFVVGSSSEEYRLHVSKLGGIDKRTGVTISTQPHIGSMFKSQNDMTWSAEQTEDIKFKMHRAKFNTNQKMKLVLNNADETQRQKLEFNPFETEEDSNAVRVYHKNHGLNALDKVKLELMTDTWITIHVTNGNLTVGQTLNGTTNGGRARITDLELIGESGGTEIYRIKVDNLSGFFAAGEGFTGVVHYENVRNTAMLESMGVNPAALTFYSPVGTIPGGIDQDYNGIPVQDLSGVEHVVQYVDSMDSYVIYTDTAATTTGRIGGDGNWGHGNIQMDVFNLQAQFIDFTGDAKWTYSGIKHAGIGSGVSDYEATATATFESAENIILNEPMKVASKTNEAMFLGAGNKSLTVTGEFSTESEYVSPMINLDSVGFTSISNRIDWNDCETYSVAPNAGEWTNSCDEEGSTARWMGEDQASGGSEGAKYIMNPVALTNPATNITVYMDVLKHLHTDVQVWYRTLPSEVEADISEQHWVKAEFNRDVVSEHDEDFREVEISIPGTNGETLPDFKSFQVKLILKSKNSAMPPKVKNFRAIAVT